MSGPPRLARRLLRRGLPPDVRAAIDIDLEEVYHRERARAGKDAADRWYWRETGSFLMRFLPERQRDRAARRDVFPYSPRQNRRGRMRGAIENWTSDFTQAARRLLRAPGFTFIVAFTLALAIGASTAIFSVVDAVLIDPLPYPASDRLVSLRSSAPGSDMPAQFPSGADLYVGYRDDADLLEDIGLFQSGQTTVRSGDKADRLFFMVSTRSVFTTLGAQPALGRLPNEQDDTEKADVVLLSDWLWRDWFAADPDVIGKSIEVSNQPRTIIGVMKPDFRFPNAQVAVWARASIGDDTQVNPGRFNLNLIARKRPGVSDQDLTTQLTTVARRLPERFGGTPAYARIMAQHVPIVRSLEEQVVGDIARPLWILLGTVGIVFLIACANVANLFIARSESRRRDLAVRQALGAGRAGLIRSLMAEALVLSIIGGILGGLLAWAGVPLLVAAAPEGVPNLDLVTLDTRAILFAVGLSVFASCLFGLAPAISFSKPAMVSYLRQAGRVGSSHGHWARNALVVVQTAAAVVLLVAAGLLVRSFVELTRVDLGFKTDNIFTFQVAPNRPDLVDGPTWAAFHRELLQRLSAMPGVESVGFVNELPLDEGASEGRFASDRMDPTVDPPRVFSTFAGGQYFETMGVPLISGRLFTESDHAGTANVLISKSAADALFPRDNPVGRQLRMMNDGKPGAIGWETVVGVVGDVRLEDFRQAAPNPMIYRPLVGPQPRSWAVGTPAYVVKSSRADAIGTDIRAMLREFVPGAPMYRVFTMDGLADRANAQLSFTMLLLAIAAGLALVLGAVGLYGVLSYVVAQRTREIAVRMALGAEAPQVRRMVVLQGGRVAFIGVVLGVVVALGLTGVLESLLFGVKKLDLVTFAAMPAIMLAVAAVACYLPARRASSVDPMQALRAD
ncbi:MAG: ABC transporter permease [Acidobacteriota bacterium]|nr:ABC transporter permease [Acidobacteriota bacterium]